MNGDKKTVGPSFQQIAQKYTNEKSSVQYLSTKIREGGAGVWGNTAMTAHPNLSEQEMKTMVDYIFSLYPKEDKSASTIAVRTPEAH